MIFSIEPNRFTAGTSVDSSRKAPGAIKAHILAIKTLHTGQKRHRRPGASLIHRARDPETVAVIRRKIGGALRVEIRDHVPPVRDFLWQLDPRPCVATIVRHVATDTHAL